MTTKKKAKTEALHGAPIEDYAMIGDCETAALVSRDGSIDWLCWPNFSSAACFAALLGTRDHGFWKIAPAAKYATPARRYKPGTMVVETTFTTAHGEVCVTDFMPPRGKNSDVVRIVRGVRGRVKMRMDLAIRFDYGRTVPWVTSTADGLHAIAGIDMVVLRTTAPLKGEGMVTGSDFVLGEGEEVSFTLTYGSSLSSLAKEGAKVDCGKALKETEVYWECWGRRSAYRGDYGDAVNRSLMTLKALTYGPTGGIVAAPTMALPEKIGGPRNWDYRYCWLRDTSFTLLVLLRAGYRDEALAWRRWLLRAIAGAPAQVQTIYGIRGEREMTEWQVPWLPGYERSTPVRVGNGAVGQLQLDVFGEVAAALSRMPEAEDDIRGTAGKLQTALTNHLCDIWKQPDQGIWEVRGKAKHFVHSKVAAWVAVDRAIQMAEAGYLGDAKGAKLAANVRRWRRVCAEIHAEVCAKGFNKRLNSFVQSYGSKALDASCLRILLVGFLPAEDPRIIGTVEAIEKGLMKDGFVQRYKTTAHADGLTGGEGAFLACSFWLASNLWLIGRKAEGKAFFERLLALTNDVGLLAEEYDAKAGRMLGNFPQALSHISLLHSAFTISGAWDPKVGAKIGFEKTTAAGGRAAKTGRK
jgi:GH15 family glucan-1,4-alpha-glucosidase